MTYKRGDVVLVRYPHSDLRGWKPRPALIVQSDDIETGLAQKLVAMITSNLSRKGETRVTVLKSSDLGKAMGIQTDSVIVADNLATVEDQIIYRKVGHCSEMDEINTALRKTLHI